MRKLKANWPAIIGLTLAVTLTQCHSDKIREEAEQEKYSRMIESAVEQMEDVYTPSEDSLYDYETGTLKDLDVETLKKR